jgi:hypothetical protein
MSERIIDIVVHHPQQLGIAGPSPGLKQLRPPGKLAVGDFLQQSFSTRVMTVDRHRGDPTALAMRRMLTACGRSFSNSRKEIAAILSEVGCFMAVRRIYNVNSRLFSLVICAGKKYILGNQLPSLSR